jgi:hypothetical protein
VPRRYSKARRSTVVLSCASPSMRLCIEHKVRAPYRPYGRAMVYPRRPVNGITGDAVFAAMHFAMHVCVESPPWRCVAERPSSPIARDSAVWVLLLRRLRAIQNCRLEDFDEAAQIRREIKPLMPSSDESRAKPYSSITSGAFFGSCTIWRTKSAPSLLGGPGS